MNRTLILFLGLLPSLIGCGGGANPQPGEGTDDGGGAAATGGAVGTGDAGGSGGSDTSSVGGSMTGGEAASPILPWPLYDDRSLAPGCECEDAQQVCNADAVCVPRCVPGDYCAVWKAGGRLIDLEHHDGSVFWTTHAETDALGNPQQSGSIWVGTSHQKNAVRLDNRFVAPSIITFAGDYLYFIDEEIHYRIPVTGGAVETVPVPEGGKVFGATASHTFALVPVQAGQSELWRTSLEEDASSELIGTGIWTQGVVRGEKGLVVGKLGSCHHASFDPEQETISLLEDEFDCSDHQTGMTPVPSGIYTTEFEAVGAGRFRMRYQPLSENDSLTVYDTDFWGRQHLQPYGLVELEGWAHVGVTAERGYSRCGIKRFPNNVGAIPESLIPSWIMGCEEQEFTIRSGDIYWAHDNAYIFHRPLVEPPCIEDVDCSFPGKVCGTTGRCVLE